MRLLVDAGAGAGAGTDTIHHHVVGVVTLARFSLD
jgi:hypothetical protein